MKTIRIAVLMAGVGSTLFAQNSDDVLRQKKIEAARAAEDALKAKAVATRQTTFEFVSGQLVSGPPVKGAPYSAEAVNETIQTLADGNRIVQRSSAMQYRDTDGRERREEMSAMGAIFITDPVAAVRYTLHPDSRSAEKGQLASFTAASTGNSNTFFYVGDGAVTTTTFAGGRSGGDGRGVTAIRIKPPGADLQEFTVATGGRSGVASSDAKTEQLGKMYIEGVQVDGTRTTTTIPAGQIGNERPINIVDERWYSPDLQMTVMTKHNDPMMGETNFSLKNINRSSPPPYLFEVPSDYTVNAGGGRGGRGVAVPAVRVFEPKK